MRIKVETEWLKVVVTDICWVMRGSSKGLNVELATCRIHTQIKYDQSNC